MDQKNSNQSQPSPPKREKQQRGGQDPSNTLGQPNRDRSQADDRDPPGMGNTRDDSAIPELDEPNVEGVGNEGGPEKDPTKSPDTDQ